MPNANERENGRVARVANRVRFNPSAKATEYTFGVEIECYVPEGSLPVGGYHNGVSLEGHGFPRGWNAQHDGSLGAYVRGYRAIEIVSPILKGVAGMLEALEVVRKLKVEYRAKVRRCCGLHVHVGLPSFVDMNASADDVLEKVANIVTVTAQSEDGLLAATGAASRIGNSFCSSIKGYVSGSDVATKAGKIAMVERMGGRYVTLNVSNVRSLRSGRIASGKPTVEFRLFNATMNPVKVAGYIMLCLGMVELAIATKTYRNRGLAATARNDSGRGYSRTGGPFAKALEQVLARVRWNSKGRAVVVNGIRSMEMLGWILPEGTGPSRKRVVSELRRLAKKLDADPNAVRRLSRGY